MFSLSQLCVHDVCSSITAAQKGKRCNCRFIPLSNGGQPILTYSQVNSEPLDSESNPVQIACLCLSAENLPCVCVQYLPWRASRAASSHTSTPLSVWNWLFSKWECVLATVSDSSGGSCPASAVTAPPHPSSRRAKSLAFHWSKSLPNRRQ